MTAVRTTHAGYDNPTGIPKDSRVVTPRFVAGSRTKAHDDEGHASLLVSRVDCAAPSRHRATATVTGRRVSPFGPIRAEGKPGALTACEGLQVQRVQLWPTPGRNRHQTLCNTAIAKSVFTAYRCESFRSGRPSFHTVRYAPCRGVRAGRPPATPSRNTGTRSPAFGYSR